MSKVAIINYGIGNLGSLERSFKRAGATPMITNDPVEIADADRILLPGVGNFGACMDSFIASGLRPCVEAHIEAGKPLLGICVGMQMMFEHSEEGDVPGLGWIAGQVCGFPSEYQGERLHVPHVGMTTVQTGKSVLFDGLGDDPRFYFTHSYRVLGTREKDTIATCNYGGAFTAAVQNGKIYGTQFHPEKSHAGGIAVLKNFAERG
jgi:glutamine amidotransferase